jgi:hypothetical protein
MSNLLPNEEKKIIRREYALRRIAVIFSLILFVIVLFLVLLIPTFLVSNSKFEEISKKAGLINGMTSETSDQNNLNLKMDEIKEKVGILNPNQTTGVNKIFSAIIDIKNKIENIKIIGLSYENKDGGKIAIAVNGISSDRESLKTFEKQVKDNNLFSNVDLPISNFTKSKDIDFSMKMETK